MNKLIVILLSCLTAFNATAQHQHKLSRAESFWGLHFDRHSQLTDDHIGATLTDGMVDSMLSMARPDYIQVDSKGHSGVSSYPTQVGQQAAGYDKDPLALIRRVTEKHNVSLFVHHSGALDANYVTNFPEEARFGPDGTPDPMLTSFFGNYSDSLLIPQLKEIALNYNVDGAWIDGESWGIYPDYQPAALMEFRSEMGIRTVPTDPKHPAYKALLEFTRTRFKDYIKHYTDEVHQVAPDFQICSNWAFSAMMPEPVPADLQLDFLSGDYDPDNALYTANWNARCLAGQGKPFDLMAWSFVRPNTPKTALQLCQEAASVISVGGGCQIYFRQNQDLSFQPESFEIMRDVADFILPRKPFCKGISIVPQVGVFYSTAGWKSQVDDVYRPFGVDDIRGVMNALLDGQQSVEILMTHQLMDRIDRYPLIVVPEWQTLEADAVEQLKKYVDEGGKLLVIGATSTGYFDDILGVQQQAPASSTSQSLAFEERFFHLEGAYREVQSLPGTEVLSHMYSTNDLRYPKGIATTVSSFGKGKIAGIYAALGSSYLTSTSPVIRDLLEEVITQLNPALRVHVEGSHKLNVVVTEKEARLLLQVVNVSGDHANAQVKAFDEIPALHDLAFTVAASQKPRAVLVQPEGTPLDFEFTDGKINFALPELKIHQIIEIR
ncbi:hypothetical protein [Parapedobacter indicus]|uniref:Beta-galactosidase trimerisation domain-containing protein n=1 Tax=Parapedobacter indicus TaxID=1477437 RepID=A0A1I3IA27_9SPHI|nr:hypothetical protein [Parapedobacter indicus]PPL02079.1 hypothetical protein CLV26_1044 [Parapedobacter indicus]SFI44838.1 hypothetical protein SAMN05444682_1044 [Parapedobacter indicus]